MDRERMCKLEEIFKHYEGQPVEILTDDGVRYCGVDIESYNDSVEIIDKCSRIILIPYSHVTAVVEPMMKLDRFCGDNDCDCRRGRDNDCDCD